MNSEKQGGIIWTGLGFLRKALSIILGFAFLVMTVLGLVQVITRYVFEIPLSWGEETIRYLFIWSTYLGAALATQKGEQISIDMANYFVGKLSPAKQATAGRGLRFTAILGELVSGVLLTAFTWKYTLRLQTLGQITPSLGIPMFMVYFGVTLGMVCLTIFALVQLYQLWREVKHDGSR